METQFAFSDQVGKSGTYRKASAISPMNPYQSGHRKYMLSTLKLIDRHFSVGGWPQNKESFLFPTLFSETQLHSKHFIGSNIQEGITRVGYSKTVLASNEERSGYSLPTPTLQ